jgi:hypothetical protein
MSLQQQPVSKYFHNSVIRGRVSKYVAGGSKTDVMKLKLKLNYDRLSVGQSVLVSGTHLEPATNFSFSLKFSLDSCGFVIL